MLEDIVYIPQAEVLRYYVYYDKDSGRIDGISCGLITLKGFETYLEVSSTMYESLDRESGKLSNWVVAFVETPDKVKIPEVVNKKTRETAFKGNVFKLVLDEVTNDTDLIVEWHLPSKHWVFSVSEPSKLRLMHENYRSSNLVFFVVLESDFDFLIRTITVKTSDIISNKVYIPFESSFELDIKKIAIAARTIFDKYGLKKVYERN